MPGISRGERWGWVLSRLGARGREAGTQCVEEVGVGGTVGGVKLVEDALCLGKARIQCVSMLEIGGERAVDRGE